MSFFKTRGDSPDDWKEKYFKLLGNHDHSEKQYKSNEDLLCKTIARLALAVKGYNKTLDPHLERIRNLLKSGLQNEQLQREIQTFSNALIALEVPLESSQLDAGLLFDFLIKQYPGRQTELEYLHEQYNNREFINYQRLFLAIAELIEHNQQSDNGFATELAIADSNAISQQLIRLLDTANLPDTFVDAAKQLKNRLQSGQALGPVFDDAVVLLLAVKKHMETEQQGLADFLATLTEDLAELGLKASGANIAHEEATKKRSNLDQDVAAQMADLQKKSASATQLEPLKQLVNIRLASISQQIHFHNLQEQEEKERVHRELRGLAQKVRDMESEAIELQTKLEAAQRRATRDPLTNLPNRKAFEDRLTEELARSGRHGVSLSMAVWDIDFFKLVNDTYGHKSGDKALMIIAKLLSKYCRRSDFLARFGGEEFVMLLPETQAQAALLVADKLRETIEKSGFNANGQKVSITLSCGITEYIDGDTNESIFERADSALYKAKQSGRNKCVLI